MTSIFSRIKYPKFLLLLFTMIIAYLIFNNSDFLAFNTFIVELGYFGTFLAGVFFAYGFTAAPATAVLLILAKQQNIFIAGFIGGCGALAGDLLIFKLIRHSFEDEIEKLKQEKIVIHVHSKIPGPLKKYLLPVIAGIIIASPLPDEIGAALFAALKNISLKLFSLISFVLNTAGIFVVLIIGKLLI